MRIEQDRLGKIKHWLHGAQAVFIFVAWVLTLAAFTREGQIGGQSGFFLALCFISVPALIYQVMVPTWSRAAKFANVYAFAVVDILFTLLWFSAPIAVATWVAAGIKEADDSDGSCNHFKFGEPAKCTISRVSVAFGFFVWILFAATTAISVMFVRQYRDTGVRPGVRDRPTFATHGDDHGKDIWSANVEERDADEDDIDERRKYGQIHEEDTQGLLHEPINAKQHNTPHPGDRLHFQTPMPVAHNPHQYQEPSALSPGGFDHDSTAYQGGSVAGTALHGRADFPVAPYERL